MRDPIPEAYFQRTSTVEALVEAIRGRVLNGEFDAGTPLREIPLGQYYRVGRHSVRAALQLLAREGLLQHEPNRGVFIPDYDAEDVKDIFVLRVALELEGISLVKRQHLVPVEAKLAVERMSSLGKDASWSTVVKADLEFHLALIEASKSERLLRVYRALQGEIALCLGRQRELYVHSSQVAAEHVQMLQILATGSEEEMRQAVRKHIEETLSRMQLRGHVRQGGV